MQDADEAVKHAERIGIYTTFCITLRMFIVLCVGVSKAPPVHFFYIQNHVHVSVLYLTSYRTVVV